MSRDSSLPPLRVYPLDEPSFEQNPESFLNRSSYDPNVPIAIDFGSSEVRAGYTNQSLPSHVFPTRLTRHRDRKINKTFTFVGNDTNLEQTLRTQSRSPFDGPMITNWDYVEDMMEYTFNHLGVVGHDGISNPILLTEKMATLQSQRSNWYQLMFECFGVPKLTFGIDSLFSYFANNQPDSTGLVISSGNEDTNVIPVVGGKGILSEAKRINWGGRHSVEYTTNLLSLKYPYFPTKLVSSQFQSMYHDFCYVSRDYDEEIQNILTMEALETKDIVVEAPFTEIAQPQKTDEELRLQAEKRKETGKRLQEQAKQRRLEKLAQKEEEYEYYGRIREQLKDQPRKSILAILQNAGFDDEQDFNKYISSLERSLKNAHILEFDEEEEENIEGKFDLVEIPDEQLTDEQIKEKRKQRLLKANYDARQRAKEEKLKQQQAEEEARRKDEEWRKEDLQGWIKDKRFKLAETVKKRKEKLKMKNDMKDRKSQAAQNRMKNLATLAEENSRLSGAKRSRQQATIDNDPNDTFGANDEDWMVYSNIAQNPEALDELLEEEYKLIVELEKELLEHDPNFTDEDTLDAQYDWRNSTLHLFLRGPRPHDSEDAHEQHQMHLNVERIRVPEVIFQPPMGGLDQAGIIELSETIIMNKFGSSRRQLSSVSQEMANNVFLTGGNVRVPGLRDRIVREFTEFLPVGTNYNIKVASDPAIDAWKGMAKFAQSSADYKESYVTKKEYEEYGPDYIKEHKLGNIAFFD